MGNFSQLAEIFRYPVKGRIQHIRDWIEKLPSSGSLREMHTQLISFIECIQPLDLAQWEELHTRTLDLNPAVAPYIGYQIWGDSYKRGEFMALLNRQMGQLQIDMDGELPDHLVPILRYLDIAPDPVPELTSIFDASLTKMLRALQKSSPENPYRMALEAARNLGKNLNSKEIGSFISEPSLKLDPGSLSHGGCL